MALLILLITLFLVLPSGVFSAEIGVFTAVEGRVDVLKGGKPPAVAAVVDMAVELNDVVRTKAESRAEIKLKDGTSIRIAPRSRIDLSQFHVDEKTVRAEINLSRGKIGTFVSAETSQKIISDPRVSKFEVKTPVAVAGVRGTSFIVNHYRNLTVIDVLTGRIYVFNTFIPDIVVDVGPGQTTSVRENRAPTAPEPSPPERLRRDLRDLTIGERFSREERREGASPIAFFAGAEIIWAARDSFRSETFGSREVTDTTVFYSPLITESIISTSQIIQESSQQPPPGPPPEEKPPGEEPTPPPPEQPPEEQPPPSSPEQPP
ncbi:MAG: FecR family protein, partial [Candidatus Bathyarchaeia archaeon]